jgi:hypothetical protein
MHRYPQHPFAGTARFIAVFISLCVASTVTADSPNVRAIKNYWQCQPSNSGRDCSIFFNSLADDAVFGSSVSGIPVVGKTAIVETISAIGTIAAGYSIKSIDGIVVDQNADGSTVFSQINKTLCGFLTGNCARNLNYALIARFDRRGKATQLLEIVPAQFLSQVLPVGQWDAGNAYSLSGMCLAIGAMCAGVPVDYGTTADGVPATCFQHWQGAPQFGADYLLADSGYSTGCVTLNMGKIARGGAPSDICRRFGVAQPGTSGCWD